jgi:hypothetical protein
MSTESTRVDFVLVKYGLDSAIAFCVQGIAIYTAALLTPYGRVYKEQLVTSISYYNHFICKNA